VVLLVVKGGVGENERVLIGPFGGVLELALLVVEEVVARREADDSARESRPHGEAEVELKRERCEKSWNFGCFETSLAESRECGDN
jgi:hypothetical protein